MNINFDNADKEINNSLATTNYGIKQGQNMAGKVSQSGFNKAAAYSKQDMTNLNDSLFDAKNNDSKNAKKIVDESAKSFLENGLSDAKQQTDYMILMSNTVSEEDYKELEENGFKVGSMTPKESVTIVDEIKVTLAKSGKVIAGYNDNLDAKKLESIAGSKIYANSIANESKAIDLDYDNSSFADSFEKYDIPATAYNISTANNALNMAQNIMPLTDRAIGFMIENELPSTIENLYMAEHAASGYSQKNAGYFMDAAGYLGKKSDNEYDAAIKNQVVNVIEKAGYEPNDENIKDAFSMIDNDITFTEESFTRYKELKNLELPLANEEIKDKISMAVKSGIKAMDTNLENSEGLINKAISLVNDVNDIEEEAVNEVLLSGKKLNIKNLSFAQKAIRLNKEVNIKIEGEKSQIANPKNSLKEGMAVLQEVRLKMTVSSTYMLLKNNINVDTQDLSLLVDELKEAENRQFESLFGNTYAVDKQELKNLYDETNEKLDIIKNLPVATVGMISSRTAFSLNLVFEEGKTLENKYQNANEKYEPLMTEVRADLGDNIKKAFRNAAELVKNLGMEASEENERAVRILGYNSREISVENIEEVKAAYNKVHDVIEKMTPSKTLELIREGVNPLNVSLDELNDKLNNKALSNLEEAERYSHFLYRMEQKGEITEEEKESFIGIYRMINAIEKNDSAAIGTLIASNGEINFYNLLNASRTRTNKGMDFSIDDNFGGLEKLNFKSKSITDQIMKAFDAANENASYEQEKRFDEIEMSYIRENVRELREAADINENIMQFVVDNVIYPSNDNIQSAKDILLNRGKTYRNVAKLSEKSTLNSKNVDNNVEKSAETESNVNKTFDFTDDTIDKILEGFTDTESAGEVFTDMTDRIDSFLTDEALKAGSYIDVKEIVATMKRMSVIKDLAKNECYEIPAMIDGELSSVRVTLKHDKKSLPNVSINFETGRYGKVNAVFGVNAKDASIEGHVLSSDEEGLKLLKEKERDFISKLNGENISRISYFVNPLSLAYSESEVNYFNSRADINNSEGGNGESEIRTKELYKIATEFMRTYL